MRLRCHIFAIVLAVPLLITAVSFVAAQQYDTRLFGEMRWRSIGPYRGGRTKAVAGAARTQHRGNSRGHGTQRG